MNGCVGPKDFGSLGDRFIKAASHDYAKSGTVAELGTIHSRIVDPGDVVVSAGGGVAGSSAEARKAWRMSLW